MKNVLENKKELTCSSCYYFKKTGIGGHCSYNPPTAISVTVKLNDGSDNSRIDSVRPYVNLDDYCSKFKF